jgi:RNA polymerase sigma-70 factor (ECF subfamily)
VNAEHDVTEPIDPDAALMGRVRDGDDEAFTRLFTQWRRPLVRFTVRLVGEQGRGETLAQDVFLQIYRTRERYEPRERFAAYVFRIATARCLEALRFDEHRAAGPPRTEPPDPAPAETVEVPGLEAMVRAAVLSLPPPERAALLLEREAGLSNEEIADALSTSVAAVRSLLARARKALVTALAAHLEDPLAAPGDAGP